jgi:hypothetical protein
MMLSCDCVWQLADVDESGHINYEPFVYKLLARPTA